MSPTGPENPVGEAVSRCKPCTRKRWTNRPSMGGAMRRSAFPCREGKRALVLEVEMQSSNRMGERLFGPEDAEKDAEPGAGRGFVFTRDEAFFLRMRKRAGYR